MVRAGGDEKGVRPCRAEEPIERQNGGDERGTLAQKHQDPSAGLLTFDSPRLD